MATPHFTHAELMILADAISQYYENQDPETLEKEGTSPVILGLVEKLSAYQAYGVPELGDDFFEDPIVTAPGESLIQKVESERKDPLIPVYR